MYIQNAGYWVCIYCTLAVILIWRFVRFSSDRQIKAIANTVVLSQVLINPNDERAYLLYVIVISR